MPPDPIRLQACCECQEGAPARAIANVWVEASSAEIAERVVERVRAIFPLEESVLFVS